MMSERKKRRPEPRPGMWSMLGAVVQSGWGPTARLLTIIAVAGIVFGGHLSGAVDLLSSLRALLPHD